MPYIVAGFPIGDEPPAFPVAIRVRGMRSKWLREVTSRHGSCDRAGELLIINSKLQPRGGSSGDGKASSSESGTGHSYHNDVVIKGSSLNRATLYWKGVHRKALLR